MATEQEKVYREQMLGMTSTPEWEAFCDDLSKEIYHNQAGLLENAQNWDQIVFAKGWNKCLAYIVSTRDRTIMEIDNEAEGDTNANV